jgi:hypothetical protein
MMYAAVSFNEFDLANPSESILSYLTIKYVTNYFKYLDPKSIKIEPEKLHEVLVNKEK